MQKNYAKWVPHKLTPVLLEMHVKYSRIHFQYYKQQTNHLLNTVVVDETWVSFNHPLKKDQSKQWVEKEKKLSPVEKLKRYEPKVMIILAMDIKGICYYEILAKKETVDRDR